MAFRPPVEKNIIPSSIVKRLENDTSFGLAEDKLNELTRLLGKLRFYKPPYDFLDSP
jgi:hypothetical protein